MVLWTEVGGRLVKGQTADALGIGGDVGQGARRTARMTVEVKLLKPVASAAREIPSTSASIV
ncbi:MAG: hypothetical protein DLM70_02110 [Chloroflexi bacterium]|nr:MAG: hypothetical protein DLM70_02110 [Chloroflexota bacterium]